MKIIRYSVDRLEGDVAVLIPDESKEKLELSASKYGLSENMIVDITFDEERIVEVKNQPTVANERLERNKSRLSALFAKGKK